MQSTCMWLEWMLRIQEERQSAQSSAVLLPVRYHRMPTDWQKQRHLWEPQNRLSVEEVQCWAPAFPRQSRSIHSLQWEVGKYFSVCVLFCFLYFLCRFTHFQLNYNYVTIWNNHRNKESRKGPCWWGAWLRSSRRFGDMKGKWKKGEKYSTGKRGKSSIEEMRDERQITQRLSDEAQGIIFIVYIIHRILFICIYYKDLCHLDWQWPSSES